MPVLVLALAPVLVVLVVPMGKRGPLLSLPTPFPPPKPPALLLAWGWAAAAVVVLSHGMGFEAVLGARACGNAAGERAAGSGGAASERGPPNATPGCGGVGGGGEAPVDAAAPADAVALLWLLWARRLRSAARCSCSQLTCRRRI